MRPVARSRWKPWLVLLSLPIILVVAAVSYVAWRQSVPGVRAELRPVPKFLGVKTPLAVDLKASRGGVASVEVKVVQGTTSTSPMSDGRLARSTAFLVPVEMP